MISLISLGCEELRAFQYGVRCVVWVGERRTMAGVLRVGWRAREVRVLERGQANLVFLTVHKLRQSPSNALFNFTFLFLNHVNLVYWNATSPRFRIIFRE